MDGSVASTAVQDWFLNIPLFALPQPMQFDDPLVQEHCANEIRELWKFIDVKKITHKQQADGKKSALHNKARAYLPASRLKSAV